MMMMMIIDFIIVEMTDLLLMQWCWKISLYARVSLKG